MITNWPAVDPSSLAALGYIQTAAGAIEAVAEPVAVEIEPVAVFVVASVAAGIAAGYTLHTVADELAAEPEPEPEPVAVAAAAAA